MKKINGNVSSSSENRSSMRVAIKQITSVVQSRGNFELIQGDKKAASITIKIIDLSTGGLCMESKRALLKGVSFDLEIPKIKNLDSTILECEVTRSIFREDPRFHVNLGTDRDKSYYEVGLKFKKPNTSYLKKLLVS